MKWTLAGVVAALTALGLSLASGLHAGMVKCRMTYSMKGWSVFYKSATGEGTVTCDNGQTVPVTLRAKGGGLTAGKVNIVDGIADISEVSSIEEVFGTYAAAEASAAVGRAAAASVVTKGPVSIALSGKGQGIDLGFSFGEFVIERAQVMKGK